MRSWYRLHQYMRCKVQTTLWFAKITQMNSYFEPRQNHFFFFILKIYVFYKIENWSTSAAEMKYVAAYAVCQWQQKPKKKKKKKKRFKIFHQLLWMSSHFIIILCFGFKIGFYEFPCSFDSLTVLCCVVNVERIKSDLSLCNIYSNHLLIVVFLTQRYVHVRKHILPF